MYAGARACMRACTYTRADTLGASAFTWSACCTSRPRRAPLIYGDRINYKERIEKSVNRLWRTVSAIILLCSFPPSLAHDRLSPRRGPTRSKFSTVESNFDFREELFLSRSCIQSPFFFFWESFEIIEQSNAIKACILCERITLKTAPETP